MILHRTCIVLAAVVSGAAAAQEPRSAIPWLSDVLASDAHQIDGLPPFHPPPISVGVSPFPPNDIETTPLDRTVSGGAGLLEPAETGLPPDLWGSTSAPRLSGLIRARRPQGVPAARRLFRDMLLARAEPPPGAQGSSQLLLARVDALMDAGMLRDAEALIESAGLTDHEVFRRAFDIGLLTGNADTRCEALRDAPALSPTLPARIFCLARLGDWSAAALSLSLGVEVGDLSPAQATLMARFLDPSLYESTPPPPVPEPLTTLDFIMREAVALPRPSGPLPLAFLHIDATDDAPLRQRIEARERLLRADAIDRALLFEAYRAGKPAASGGVWDRAAAIQALDRAFAVGDAVRIGSALLDADALFSEAGLRSELARTYAQQLRARQPEAFANGERQTVAELLLLAGAADAAAAWLPSEGDAQNRFFIALADPDAAVQRDGAPTPLMAAAARGLTADAAPTPDAATIAALIQGDGFAEGLLRTLDLLASDSGIDPDDLEAALYLLRLAGLEPVARQVAIETLLLLPAA